jgi:fructoselysine 6-kinase
VAIGPGAGGRLDVACVGDNCVDVSLERAGEELAGGNAFNVAVELARAGLTTSYFGAVGTDARAELILDAAHEAGVDVAGVQSLPGATGVTVVARDDGGERSFVSQDYGVAADYRLDEATSRNVSGHRWAHFARQPDLADWAPALRGAGTRLSCDLGVDMEPGTLPRVGPYLDVAFFSTSAAGDVPADELLREALACGVGLAVVTLGAKGSVAAGRRQGRWRSPAVPVDDVVDTLGAGDAFIAAFVAATLDDSDVDAALRAGAAAGAQACTRRGLANPLAAEEAAAAAPMTEERMP